MDESAKKVANMPRKLQASVASSHDAVFSDEGGGTPTASHQARFLGRSEIRVL